MNPCYAFSQLPWQFLAVFIVSLFFFQSQFSAKCAFAIILPAICFAAVRTVVMSLFSPYITLAAVMGFIDTVHGETHMFSFVFTSTAVVLLIALSYVTSLGETVLASSLFGSLVSLKEPTQLYSSIIGLLGLEAGVITATFFCQVVILILRGG